MFVFNVLFRGGQEPPSPIDFPMDMGSGKSVPAVHVDRCSPAFPWLHGVLGSERSALPAERRFRGAEQKLRLLTLFGRPPPLPRLFSRRLAGSCSRRYTRYSPHLAGECRSGRLESCGFRQGLDGSRAPPDPLSSLYFPEIVQEQISDELVSSGTLLPSAHCSQSRRGLRRSPGSLPDLVLPCSALETTVARILVSSFPLRFSLCSSFRSCSHLSLSSLSSGISRLLKIFSASFTKSGNVYP